MRARLSALLLSSMLAVLLHASATPHPAARATQQPAGERTGDVIVRFHDGASLADVGQALAASDTAAVKSGSPSIAVVRPEGGQSVDAAVDALNANLRVDYAEPDLRVTIAATPNDPQYGSQWHYPNVGATGVRTGFSRRRVTAARRPRSES